MSAHGGAGREFLIWVPGGEGICWKNFVAMLSIALAAALQTVAVPSQHSLTTLNDANTCKTDADCTEFPHIKCLSGSCNCALCSIGGVSSQVVCAQDEGCTGGCMVPDVYDQSGDTDWKTACCRETPGCNGTPALPPSPNPPPPSSPSPPPPSPPPHPPFPPGKAPYPPPPTASPPAGKPKNSAPKPSSSSDPCFAKDSTTACLLASPSSSTCLKHVLMADLVPGDLVLGREGATAVVAVQHKAVDTIAQMLTFHTFDGAVVSMTPDHGVFVDGELVAAADAKVGSRLSAGVVERITKGEAKIINAVTADGTIVADGVLAASNPLWVAQLTIDAPIRRALVNAVLYAAGDVDSIADGVVVVLAKLAATLTLVALAAKALKPSSA